ncbi:hypothetical protein CY34DRAFT_803166 [Suillus luteus UH-Slu-Lm8-n1]|uniref:Uncharacterized protein n=1 Tax=Suillus luteus UH-Slu-Lm8-n1 TaxID=930992 RepID=A0A0D0A280_9AGAM|nr:hypothetical protein CY34DRAFT_803166 [Suillus luteus UH-Slu-Lm8-n1]
MLESPCDQLNYGSGVDARESPLPTIWVIDHEVEGPPHIVHTTAHATCHKSLITHSSV